MEIDQNIVDGLNKRRKKGKIRKYVKRHHFFVLSVVYQSKGKGLFERLYLKKVRAYLSRLRGQLVRLRQLVRSIDILLYFDLYFLTAV